MGKTERYVCLVDNIYIWFKTFQTSLIFNFPLFQMIIDLKHEMKSKTGLRNFKPKSNIEIFSRPHHMYVKEGLDIYFLFFF